MRFAPKLIAAVAMSATIAGCGLSGGSALPQLQGWLADGNMLFEVIDPAEEAHAVTAEAALEIATIDLDVPAAPGGDQPPPWRPLDESPVLGRFSCTAPNCRGWAPAGPRLAWMVWGGGTPPRTMLLIDASTGEVFMRGAPPPDSLDAG